MILTLRRFTLVVLTVVGAYTGFWAYFAPRHWHDRFPGFGRSWLPQLGPFNEHLAKDTGAMFLALTVLSVVALRYVRNDVLVRTAGLAWLTFNVLHLIYHLQHLHMYGTFDKILNVVGLSAVVLLSITLLPAAARQRVNT
jgi:hypothetical protein